MCDGRHELVGARVVVRPPRREDEDEFFASIDQEVRYWQGYDDDALQPWIDNFDMLARFGVRGCPLWLIVAEPDTDALLGSYVFEGFRQSGVSLGWWLGPTGRGRGLAAESLALVLGYGHDHLRLPEIHMGTTATNARALRQIQRTGAQVIDTGDYTLPNGVTVPSIWHKHVVT